MKWKAVGNGVVPVWSLKHCYDGPGLDVRVFTCEFTISYDVSYCPPLTAATPCNIPTSL